MSKTVNTSRKPLVFDRVSWGAIIAGTVTALVIIVLLNLLGTAIGLATIEPTEEKNPLAGLGTGAAIWWVISNLIALFAGGWVAGRLSGVSDRSEGLIHGFLTWALYTVVSIVLISSAVGSVINSAGSIVNSTLSTVGQGVGQLAPEVAQAIDKQINTEDITLDNIKSEVYALLEDTDKAALDPDRLENDVRAVRRSAQRNAEDAAMQPGRVNTEVEQIFNRTKNRFGDAAESFDKEALANILAERTDMSKSEAMATVENWENQFQEVRAEAAAYVDRVKQNAAEISDKATDATATAAIIAFFALLAGAIAASMGGEVGRPDLIEQEIIVDNTRDDDAYVRT